MTGANLFAILGVIAGFQNNWLNCPARGRYGVVTDLTACGNVYFGVRYICVSYATGWRIFAKCTTAPATGNQPFA